MGRYVALLRGINVGGNKLVPMATLRALLEGLGYADVATLLNSGNAVFTSGAKDGGKIAAAIEKVIAKEFGFEVSVVVRSRDELAKVIAANPLKSGEKDPSKFLVFLLSGSPEKKAIAAIDAKAHAPDEFRLAKHEIYARFPNGIQKSKLAGVLGSPKLGVASTARNWNTVLKLLELVDR